MNFEEAWDFLDKLQFFKIKLGLDSMSMFLTELQDPQRKLRFIHVAGTNGKGSVAVTLMTLLAAAGYKVGLYTSPHLSSVRERFRINDNYISKEDFAEHATRIRNILNDRQITYFEFTAALAFLWFAQEQVDVAILEVGMGGRLDATNVITPLVSVITNVAMDHEAYLGNTLAAVASEKAGIIKPDVPVVAGVSGMECLDVVAGTAADRKAPLYLLGRDFHASEGSDRTLSYQGINGRCLTDLEIAMKGRHQRHNASISLATLEIIDPLGFHVSETIIRQALPEVRWPGRLEYFTLPEGDNASVNPTAVYRYLLDGAHNPDGVQTLRSALENDFVYRKLIMIWGSMADKDIATGLRIIAPLCDHILLTMPESERSATPAQLLSVLPEREQPKGVCVATVPEALARAGSLAGHDDLICVAGSLYLIGAVRKKLCGELVK